MADNCLPEDVNGGKTVPKRHAKPVEPKMPAWWRETVGYPPTPWEAVRYENVEYQYDDTVSIEESHGTVIREVHKDLARRIIACANFLHGVPTSVLETLAKTHHRRLFVDDIGSAYGQLMHSRERRGVCGNCGAIIEPNELCLCAKCDEMATAEIEDAKWNGPTSR